MSNLIRDFFETTPLLTYAAINKLARNRIEDFNVDPVRAVHDACDMYLGAAYQPSPLKFVENIHTQERRIQQTRKRKALSNYQQLSLFPQHEAA